MSPQMITLLGASFFAAQFIAGPILGQLSDKYGRIPVLIISQIGTVISFIMLAQAQQVWVLFAARILDGITGGNIIVAQAYVTDVTPRERRTEALGYVFAAFGFGFVVGPAIGGLAAGTLNQHAPYYIAAFVTALVVILTWFVLEETITPDMQAAQKQKRGQGMSFNSVVTNMPLISILLIGFGAQFAFAMLQSTFSLFGEAVLFADTPERAELGVGLLMAMLGVGQIVTQLFLVKQLVKRYGESSLVVVGGVIRSISMFVLVLIAVPASAALALFLFAMGTGMQLPSLQSLITNTVADDQRGAVIGWFQSSMTLAIIVGTAVAGSLFEIAPIVPYILGGVVFAVMLIPAFFLGRWVRREEIKRTMDMPAVVTVGD